MKNYIIPELEVTDFRMSAVICLSMTDEETNEALGNKRGSIGRDEAKGNDREPWKDGLC